MSSQTRLNRLVNKSSDPITSSRYGARSIVTPTGDDLRAQCVQRQVELEDIDARLADQSDEALFGVFLHQGAHTTLIQAARPGDRRNLRQRELRRNMRIEAGAGR